MQDPLVASLPTPAADLVESLSIKGPIVVGYDNDTVVNNVVADIVVDEVHGPGVMGVAAKAAVIGLGEATIGLFNLIESSPITNSDERFYRMSTDQIMFYAIICYNRNWNRCRRGCIDGLGLIIHIRMISVGRIYANNVVSRRRRCCCLYSHRGRRGCDRSVGRLIYLESRPHNSYQNDFYWSRQCHQCHQ